MGPGWTQIPPYTAQLAAIDEIEKGSDRIATIVGVTLLDDALTLTVGERLTKSSTAEGLLSINGAVGTLDAKLKLLYALGGCAKDVRQAMEGLAKVRNFFAHNLDKTFAARSTKLQEAMKLLTLHQGRHFYPHHIWPERTADRIEAVKDSRTQFLVNLKLCLRALMHDRLSHRTHTCIPFSKAEFKREMAKAGFKRPRKKDS